MSKEVLTPRSPRWEAFCDQLVDTLTDGMPEGQWRCGDDGSGRSKHRYAEQVMTKMGNVDIAGSIAYFETRGGYCDCEVWLNVATEPERQEEKHD